MMEKKAVAVVGKTESHQQLKRAEELARLVSHKKDLYENKDGWTNHQELVSLYRDILITDMEFALDRKVEQDLWNFCFKNYISHLQSKVKDKRQTGRADSQLLLSWFLEFASGFYTTFLTEIQQKFQLDIPFLQSGDPYGLWSSTSTSGVESEGGGGGGGKRSRPGVTSCNYLCQHCLVHMGDLARYRNQLSQAETFYREATSLAPGSGQPYNQIAILEASRANKLSAVYFYVRAICLKYPFPAASTNLSKMLGKFANNDVEKAGKMSQQMFTSLLLKLHGLLHHAEKLRLAVKTGRLLSESLTNLIVSESLTTWQLVQVVSINMWACHSHQAEGAGRGGHHYQDLSPEERLVLGVVAGLQAALLSSCLLPVYTLKKGEQLLDYSALPVIRLLLEWILSQPAILQERGFTSRPQIWPGLARLLNEVQPLTEKFESSRYRDFPLPEDYDLQAFSPLAGCLSRYNMKSVMRGGGGPRDSLDQDSLARLRCARLLEVGQSLCGLNPRVIQHCHQTNSFQAVEGELVHVREDPEVLVEEIEMLEDIDSSEECDSPPPVWEEDNKEQTKSILKSKTELTPSPVLTPPGVSPLPDKARAKPFQRNVAMAAIMNCVGAGVGESTDTSENLLSAENKKVMFKTPSPGNSQASTVDSSQLSASQDDFPPAPVGGGVRRSWSPPPQVPRSKICVAELDLSVPPPSLHSNVRPPALFSPGPEFTPSQYGQEADSASVFSPARPSEPLLHLLTSVDRQDRQDRPSSLGLSSFSAPAPARPAAAPAYPQSYSLFSPTGWPGPLLSSPHTPGHPGPGSSNQQTMFGGAGPSPLERLLHQVRPLPR